MKDASLQALFGTALRMMMMVPVACFSVHSDAQERAGLQIAPSFPFAASIVTVPKSARSESGAKLSGPVIDTIAPDARSQSSLALPERRTVIDEMLQSHEFKFGTKPKASALTSKRPPVGTNMDLDAVKLRISRDKVMLKAEWTFN
jgi:hypothetical protein